MKATGLFGGSFDPIHNAHVRLAATFRDALQLDEVWFLVTPQNPWKRDSSLSADRHRLNMVRLALEGEPGLIASDYEFSLPSPSYTFQTLRHLRHDYPDTAFTLLVGGDNWEAFDHWAEYGEILSHHTVAVYPRPGHTVATPQSIAERGWQPVILEAQQMDISSTEIRRLAAENGDFDSLVHPDVAQYIKRYGLYG